MQSPRRVALMFELEWPHKRHAEIFAGAQQYADEHGWETVIEEFVGPEREGSRLFDGIIGRVNPTIGRWVLRVGVPTVNVWFSSPDAMKLPGVFPDFAAAGRMQAEHLLDRGLRQFCVLARSDRAAKTEVVAFRERIKAAGFSIQSVTLPVHPVRSLAKWRSAERQIEAAMDQWQLPIGVFACVDEIGRKVAQMCRHRNWRVPEDVAIIAGANETTLCERPRPSLSSMEFNYLRVGYEAAKLLDSLMDKKQRGTFRPEPKPTHISIPPQGVVMRESTDFFAVKDPLVAAALAYISAHCHRAIKQTDVAKAVNAEVRTLHNRFRKALDRPVAAMVQFVRLERAKRELAQSDRLLRAIARDTGFGTRARMSEAFRRELGMTPAEYRRLALAERGAIRSS
jgi:LacI family transcriptional regulator